MNMTIRTKDIALLVAIAVLLSLGACSRQTSPEAEQQPAEPAAASPFVARAAPAPSPQVPDLQAEILDNRYKSTGSPLGSFDFKNFTYPLPRGWQHPDGDEITLLNGKLEPRFKDIHEEMTPEEKAAARLERRIGMSYVTTRFLDADGDGQEDAAVILKVETGGSAIPQLVYIYGWKDGQPELRWSFRTGDRADGGLKDLRAENGELVVELYGQDRFLLGPNETSKITGDEEQICCPLFFTRSFYKWNGRSFQLQRKRLTYEVANLSAPPLENHGDIMNDPVKGKKYLEGQKHDR
jgi:hypothetical protein